VSANIFYAKMDSPIGSVWVAKTDAGICAVELEDDQPDSFFALLSRHVGKEPPRKNRKALAPALTQLREYFSRIRREFDLTLDVDGTAFQMAVWNQTARIPYGRSPAASNVPMRRERSEPH
jgi:methylated-DNA-[protein]-cysteine S-methyltransferase